MSIIEAIRYSVQSYGVKYTGIYLFGIALIALVYTCKNNKIDIFVKYLFGIALLIFLVVGIRNVQPDFLSAISDGDVWVICPIALVIALATTELTIGHKKIVVIGVLVLLIVIEASVPLQWDFYQIGIPTKNGKMSRDLAEISEIVKGSTVVGTADVFQQLEACDKDIIFPLESWRYDSTNLDAIFEAGRAVSSNWVLVKYEPGLKDDNKAWVSQRAEQYNYEVKYVYGRYILCEMQYS